MSNFNDIQDLWKSRQTKALPTAAELMKEARKSRARMVRMNLLAIVTLTFTVIVIAGVLGKYDFEYVTTRIGALLVILTVIAAIFLNSQLLHIILSAANSETDSRQYLRELLRYREKQRFFQTTGISVYFILLSIGMGLYFYEFLAADLKFGLIVYGVSFAWVLIAWIWIRPRSVRKHEKRLNLLIEQVEQVVKQLDEE